MFLEQVMCFTRFHLGHLAYNAVDYTTLLVMAEKPR